MRSIQLLACAVLAVLAMACQAARLPGVTSWACCAILALVVLGCQSSDVEAPERPTRSLLADRLDFDIQREASMLRVTGHRGTKEAGRAVVPVMRGNLAMRVEDDGAIVLEAMDLELDDIQLSAEELPPSGIHLTNLRLHLAGEAAGASGWSDAGDQGFAQGTVDLKLDWAVALRDGGTSALATQTLEDIPIYLAVQPSFRGLLSARVVGLAMDTVWQWAEVIELSDLSLDLRGQAPVPAVL